VRAIVTLCKIVNHKWQEGQKNALLAEGNHKKGVQERAMVFLLALYCLFFAIFSQWGWDELHNKMQLIKKKGHFCGRFCVFIKRFATLCLN